MYLEAWDFPSKVQGVSQKDRAPKACMAATTRLAYRRHAEAEALASPGPHYLFGQVAPRLLRKTVTKRGKCAIEKASGSVKVQFATSESFFEGSVRFPR